MVIVLIIFILVAVFLIHREIKSIHEPNVYCITGGVKVGKTTLTMWLARRRYRRILLKYYITLPFKKLFRKNTTIEKPLFYTNVPVRWKHVLLTEDLLLREKRFAYKSVVVIQEASLIADSRDFKNEDVNEKLKYFVKLFGHETHSGYLYLDTQNLLDVHYNFKRCLTSYLWIHHCTKWVPFIHIMKVREMFYSDEQGVINSFNEDIEETTKTIIIFKRIHKYFDSHCYSKFTDDKEVVTTLNNPLSFKADTVVNFDFLKKDKKELEKNDRKRKTN